MSSRLEPRVLRGFRDVFAAEVTGRRRMIDTIRTVYERYGFEPLETPAVELAEVLGKYLPESDLPDEGVFAFRDEGGTWISLRYDLTAPLSRVVAQYAADLPMPFRRYQIGPVWRREKPGPGRFREFFQFDIDTVGSASMAADAEVSSVLAESMEALGIARGDYRVRVNDRKILNGVLETIGIAEGAEVKVTVDRGPKRGSETLRIDQRLTILRTMDKLDRLGLDGLRELLGRGRKDESGDFTPGAQLTGEQVDRVIEFMKSGTEDRGEVLDLMAARVGKSQEGLEGVAELRRIDGILTALGLGSDRVVFDPSVVRGLAYYTGPVFEVELTFEVADETGARHRFGSVAGGGRYDDLVMRFTGEKVPATGASIGVDRLYTALSVLRSALGAGKAAGPVLVTVLDPAEMGIYQEMAAELRAAGIAAEAYLGEGRLGPQLKYADRRNSPAAVLAGQRELTAGTVSVKDLVKGQELADEIEDRDEWRKGQPAQVTVPRVKLVETVRSILGRISAR